MSGRIRLLLADDHAVVRAGYRLLLEPMGNIEIVGEAERGEEACSLYWNLQPDVVLMDLNLPGIGGLAAIHRICSGVPNAKILVFSIHDELIYVNRALEAGARGYLTKSCRPELLGEAIVRIARGATFIEPDLAQHMIAATLQGRTNNALQCLSPREFDVFSLLAKGHTAREIAQELCLSYKTVCNYTTLVKNKLLADTNADLTLLAFQHGLLNQRPNEVEFE